MDTKLVPYLSMDGTAAEAMRFYQTIFGGELTMQTYGDAQMGETVEVKKRIMHAQLKTDEFTLMASDSSPDHGSPVVVGNTVNLSVIGSDTEKLTTYFHKLADGGTITMPLEKQFWGDTFGACVDKFGFNWMVNITATPG